MAHLELILKKKWFDMIESGEKLEEYRELKQYWWKRVFTSPCDNLNTLPIGSYNGKHSTVRFSLGYGKYRKQMVFKMGHVGIGMAKPEIAEGNMNKVIVIPLLKRLS
jgi:hypothetical protein